ncbi:MAG TPA: TonB-dependent receptor [Novosphingobium sp.]|nr:TonB-dependent receptor [Novosphingobium sp.]
MKYLFLLGYSLAVAAPAVAQDADDTIMVADRIRDNLITVVATGTPLRTALIGQSVSIVDNSEIASIQGADLTRVLERLPGVTITRNGGLGNFTGVRIRGADAEQLLVLVDGVRVADVASPGGGFDFGNLVSGGIGKIELLRGSNSVVWGSQAIGGVLALTSREFDGVEASAEYGAHDSFDGSAVAGLSGDAYAVTLNGGYTRTDGISTAASGTEPDGFRQWRVGGRGRLDIASGLTATLNGRYADSRLDIDGFPPPTYRFADTPEYQTSREASGRAGLAYDTGLLHLTGGYALSDTRRAYFDPTYSTAPNFETQGRSEHADLSGHIGLPSNLTLDFGADSEWSRFSTTYDAEKTARLSSGHALLGYHADGLNLAAGVRLDDHNRYGSAWTFGANGSVDLGNEGWRIRASYGEGFKAPTLYQLYGYGGNTTLNPEESRSFDLGIERGDRNGPLHFALTGFRRDSSNLIDYRFPSGYFNVGKARAEGFEAEADVRPTDRLGFHAAYSYVKATNRVTGKDLARRPRHALTLATDWRTPLHDLTLGADLRLVGDSFDDAGNFAPLDGYALVTLRASLPVTEQLELYGRVENLGDVSYQTATGYGTSGRAAYAGVRVRF